ncbi:Uncharacterised protein [Clostridioides difficile]|uniref:hypothetical protein n=1 Tax=Clostridioides difficile TaxID=1496 RepID=UPI00098001DE|nr:hypothetical protein [Clostridioides difficile]SJP68436.1 Uncharacterised protein [Clostridioides difficile]
MAKLQYEVLNKGIEMEEQLYAQLNSYDDKVVGAVDKQIADLKAELEHLTVTANKITLDTDMDEYMANQQRLKELPNLIVDAERERLKLINNKQSYKEDICKGIYREVGSEYVAEFSSNMEALMKEYDKALSTMIAIDKQMRELEADYKNGLYSVMHTKGVYMTIDRASKMYGLHSDHNLNDKSIDLQYAK